MAWVGRRLNVRRISLSCLVWVLVLLGAFCVNAVPAMALQSSSVSAFPARCTVAPADAECPDCLRFSPVVMLGRGPGEGFLEDRGTITDVVRDTSGNLWVGQRHRIKVFDSNGRYLRTVGRAGEGPGEYVFAQPRLVDTSGNIHVVDVRQFRVTVVSPGGEVVDTWRLPFPPRYWVLFADGDRLFGAFWDSSPERVGLPLHVLSSDGTVLHSFGAPDKGVVSRDDADLRVGVDPQGNLYSAAIEEYRIDIWTQDGQKVSRITGPQLNPDDHPDTDTLDPEWRPLNKIASITGLNNGIVAVVARFRRDDWRENSEMRTSPSGRVSRVPRSLDFSNWYYSTIDVIDVGRCTVIASGEYDGFLTRFLSDDQVVELTKTELGEARLKIVSVEGLP